jgi:uncharacterized membrane protein YkvA (DUF1232 family)
MVSPAKVRRAAALRALWEALRGASRPGAPSVGARLRAFPRMLTLGLTGRYPHLAKNRMGMAVLALLYILSPVDVVPELLVPLLGLADDALVAAWLAGVVLSETDAFLTWERDRSKTVTGEVLA